MILKRRRSGFTLIELLLVVLIVIIISAAAYPTINGWYGDTRVKAAADDIRGAWAEARAHAVDEGVNYRFAVIEDSGRLKVAPDDPKYWDGTDDSSDTESIPGAGTMTLRRTLPKEIKFKIAPNTDGTTPQADSGGWTTLLTFLPDGTCKEDANIELHADGVQSVLLKMRGLTGTSKTETVKP